MTALRKNLPLIFLAALIAGFILIFIPRFPKPLIVVLEIDEETRPILAELDVTFYQNGETVKTIKKFYRERKAPKIEKIKLNLQSKPFVVEINGYPEQKTAPPFFSQKHSLRFQSGDQFTFYISRR
ncbi:MAG: hypothetical protein Kow0090_08110 [Myxococcota bacterium]